MRDVVVCSRLWSSTSLYSSVQAVCPSLAGIQQSVTSTPVPILSTSPVRMQFLREETKKIKQNPFTTNATPATRDLPPPLLMTQDKINNIYQGCFVVAVVVFFLSCESRVRQVQGSHFPPEKGRQCQTPSCLLPSYIPMAGEHGARRWIGSARQQGTRDARAAMRG